MATITVNQYDQCGVYQIRNTINGKLKTVYGYYTNILQAAKVNVQVELFIKMIDWTPVDSDGLAIDLDDPRLAEALPMLESAGLIPVGYGDEVIRA